MQAISALRRTIPRFVPEVEQPYLLQEDLLPRSSKRLDSELRTRKIDNDLWTCREIISHEAWFSMRGGVGKATSWRGWKVFREGYSLLVWRSVQWATILRWIGCDSLWIWYWGLKIDRGIFYALCLDACLGIPSAACYWRKSYLFTKRFHNISIREYVICTLYCELWSAGISSGNAISRTPTIQFDSTRSESLEALDHFLHVEFQFKVSEWCIPIQRLLSWTRAQKGTTSNSLIEYNVAELQAWQHCPRSSNIRISWVAPP